MVSKSPMRWNDEGMSSAASSSLTVEHEIQGIGFRYPFELDPGGRIFVQSQNRPVADALGAAVVPGDIFRIDAMEFFEHDAKP